MWMWVEFQMSHQVTFSFGIGTDMPHIRNTDSIILSADGVFSWWVRQWDIDVWQVVVFYDSWVQY